MRDHAGATPLRNDEQLTVGVFALEHRAEVEELAAELASLRYEVELSSLEGILHSRATRTRSRSLEITAGTIAGLIAIFVAGTAVLNLTGDLELTPEELLGLSGVQLVAMLACALTIVTVQQRPGPQHSDRALRALSPRGRFALVVRAPAAHQPFVDARLRHSSALAVAVV